MTHLDRRILNAWTATENMHQPNPAATRASVTAAEHMIGRRLPQAFHDLYLIHDGAAWLNHDLNLLPLDDGNELSVTSAAATHRRWKWPTPDEVVIFGNDGSGEPFGLWLSSHNARSLVVTIGAIFEPGCMGIVGQHLNAFLKARTAYYFLPPDDTTTPGLDALAVPEDLRAHDPDDTTFTQTITWASPSIPPHRPTPTKQDSLPTTRLESHRPSDAPLSCGSRSRPGSRSAVVGLKQVDVTGPYRPTTMCRDAR